jgi:hypothetical protein
MNRSFLLAGLLLLFACDDKEKQKPSLKSDASAPSGGARDAGQLGADAATNAGLPGSSGRDGGQLRADAATDAGTAPGQDSSRLAGDASLSSDASPPIGSTDALPTTDFAAAAAIATRGRECGVIGEGTWSWMFFPGQFCESLCILKGSCAEFKDLVCQGGESASATRCLDACEASPDSDEDVARCGDGTTIPSEQLCDLKPDCANGEDEKHCTLFSCKDGSDKVSEWKQCDGLTDCEDGSDEEGCATVCGEPRGQEL